MNIIPFSKFIGNHFLVADGNPERISILEDMNIFEIKGLQRIKNMLR